MKIRTYKGQSPFFVGQFNTSRQEAHGRSRIDSTVSCEFYQVGGRFFERETVEAAEARYQSGSYLDTAVLPTEVEVFELDKEEALRLTAYTHWHNCRVCVSKDRAEELFGDHSLLFLCSAAGVPALKGATA
jgi:hypothetical protein